MNGGQVEIEERIAPLVAFRLEGRMSSYSNSETVPVTLLKCPPDVSRRLVHQKVEEEFFHCIFVRNHSSDFEGIELSIRAAPWELEVNHSLLLAASRWIRQRWTLEPLRVELMKWFYCCRSSYILINRSTRNMAALARDDEFSL
jgi:hypothetical protein